MYDFQELIDALSSGEQNARTGRELGKWLKENPEALKDPNTYFQKVIPLIKKEEGKAEAIYIWLKLSQEPLSLHQFVSEILPMIPQEYRRVVVPLWFGMPGNIAESNKIILPALTTEHFDFISTENPDEQVIQANFPSESDRALLILGWLLNPANDIDEATLIKLIDLLDVDSDPIDSMVAWASKSVGNDRFLKILLNNKDPIKVDRLVQTWLENPSNLTSDDEVIAVISQIEQRPSDFNHILITIIINSWLRRSENNLNTNALNKFLSFIKNLDIKADVLNSFISNIDHDLSAKFLIMILPVLTKNIAEIGYRSKFNSVEIVRVWLSWNASSCSADDLIDIFNVFGSDKSFNADLAKQWLENQSMPCDAKTLIKIFRFLLEDAEEINQLVSDTVYSLAKSWIEENPSASSVDDIVEMIDVFGSYKDYSYYLAKQLLENKSMPCDAQTFIKLLLKIAGHEQDRFRFYFFVKTWMGRNPSACSADDLIEILQVFGSNSDYNYTITKEWLEKQSKPCDIKSLIKITSRFNIYKSILEDIWLKGFADTDLRFSAFLELVRSGGLTDLFDYSKMYSSYTGAGFGHDRIADLAKGLFPDYEFAQVDCFKEFVRASYLHGQPLATQLKALAVSLKDADCCLEILEFGLKKKCLAPLDILLLAKGRLSSNFSSVVELLNIPLHECLKEGCMDEIIDFFGPNLPTDLTLADLFSYYEVTKGLDKFRQMVEPKTFTLIFNKYQPTEKSPYITREEQAKLVSLGIKPLPQMVILAGYLKSKLPATPSVESSMLVMVKDKTMEDNDLPEWQEDFFSLLIADEPQPSDVEAIEKNMNTVFEFFQKITGQPLGGEKSKLYELFRSLKNELAFLFSKKDGITNYLATLSGIGHGCVANISMKTKMYVYGELFKDIQDRYLYPFYCEKIAVPFLQKSEGGDKLGASATGSEADPLTNSSILQLHLSPPGMIAALSREFYAGGETYQVGAKAQQIAISPHKVIEFFLGKDSEQLRNFNDNLYDLSESYAHLPAGESEAASLKKQAEMAAYLLLCKVVSPQSQYQRASTSNALVDDPSFERIKNHYEEWLKKAPQNLNRPAW